MARPQHNFGCTASAGGDWSFFAILLEYIEIKTND
jgi:hypothetical protein